MPHRLRNALLLEDGGIISLVGAGGKTSLMYCLARELAAEGQTVLTTTTTRILAPTPEQSPGVILSADADEILERAVGMLQKQKHITVAGDQSPETGKLVGFAPETIDRLLASRIFDWIIVEADGAAGRPLKAPADHEPVIPASTGWLIGMVGLSAIGKPLSEEGVFRSSIFSSISDLPPGAEITTEAVAAAIVHERGILKNAPSRCRRLVFLNQADTDGRKAVAMQILKSLQRAAANRIERVIIGQVMNRPRILAVHDLAAA
jgi:probable selenium-dependent hydroxylase accessory protein YqeC